MDYHEARVMATVGQGCRFPLRLHQLLDSTEKADKGHIVSWLPGGKSFKVHDKAAFAKKVLPLFFGTSKYRSFQKNINLWGFHTVPKGPEKGRCSHPRFQKGLPVLCHSMERVTVKGTPAAMRASNTSVTPENESLDGSSNLPGQPRAGAEDSGSPLMQSVQPIPAAYSASPMQAGQPIPPPSTGYIGTASRLRPAGFNPLFGPNNQVGNTRGNPIDPSSLTELLLNDINALNALRGFLSLLDNVEMTRLRLGNTTRPRPGQLFSLNEIIYQTNDPLVRNRLQFFPVANNAAIITDFLTSSRGSSHGTTATGGNTTTDTLAENAFRYLLNLPPFSRDDTIL
jgi:hypothetical protein